MIDGTRRPSQAGYMAVSDAVYAETAERFAGLSDLAQNSLVPAILGELARLGQTELTPVQRYGLLEPLRPLIRHATARLPKPSAGASGAGGEGEDAPTIEQRLYLLMVENLKLLLRDLDRPKYFDTEGREAKRRWAQVYLMKTLGRQIFYAGRTGRRVPAGTWQALHGLFYYLVMRAELTLQRPGGAPRTGSGFQFEPAYKSLLLIGFYDRVVRPASGAPNGPPPVDRMLARQFSQWALEDTWLLEPGGLLDRNDLILVETTKDAPPRLASAVLHESFRGWVLVPAQGFLDLLADGGAALRRHLPPSSKSLGSSPGP